MWDVKRTADGLLSVLFQPLDPARDGGIVWHLLVRFFRRGQRLVFAAEDEEDLDAQLDERLVEREVRQLLMGHERERAAHELQRDFRLRIVERIRGKAMQHAR